MSKMLDLKKLGKQLDEALAKETAESLNAWLYEKRNKRSILKKADFSTVQTLNRDNKIWN